MKERTISILCALLVLFLWTASLPCSAQDATAPAPPQQDSNAAPGPVLQPPPQQEDSKAAPEEVSISAERMEMQMEGNTIELSGNVLIYDSTMNLTAEKMTVFLDKDNKLERVEALNNVTIRKLNGSESATGERGSYDSINELITLEGNCTLLQGKNVLNCSEIVYDRKKQTITAKGASLNIRDLKNRGNGNSDFLKLKKEESPSEEKK